LAIADRGTTLLVEVALLPLTLGAAVISDTSDRGLPLAVGLPTTKGTTQVFPAGITRMSEEKDPAMPAPDQASSQKRLGPQNRSQEYVIP
jgi:hypothetical protein